MIRFGFCTGPENLPIAAAAGCDYLEFNFSQIADMPEEDFQALQKTVESFPLRVEAMNGFIPARYRLTGPEADHDTPLPFVEEGLKRAAALGVKHVVFGSGGARRVPEGFPIEEANNQIASFARLVAALAAEQGITVVIEPLRKAECNIIRSVDEALGIYRLAGEPEGLAVLADLFHMAEEREDFSSILRAGSVLRHCHIANPAGRTAPLAGDSYDYLPFFHALHAISYSGGISIEASVPHPEEVLADSLRCLRDLDEV